MKTRKMWALQAAWYDEDRCIDFSAREEPPTDMRVLVTSLEGAPDFEPGDRVEADGGMDHMIVDSPPQMSAFYDFWTVSCRRSSGALACYPCHTLTKLPREKSVLLRVTFAGHPDPDGFVSNLETCEGVRVERVEDPDE